MRAGDQRRYHDILRREARPQTSKLCRGSAPVAAQVSGASLVCDPLAELNIPSTAVPEVVEYVCDRRGFTSLHPNFLRFEHLRCIVLEHNALETLHNLLLPPPTLGASSPASTITAADGLPLLPPPPPLYRGCRQLTHLHAAYNRISDIAGGTDIPRLFLLEHLSLAHNQLAGLSKVLDALKRLRNLRFLDLRGNPVTGEPRYRERCIAALPQVEVLDRQSVAPKEREEAAAPARWNGRTHENRSCSTATSTATAGSSARPRSSPSCTKGLRAAGDPFAKSLTAKDLERAYAAYLRQQQQAQEAAAQSTAAAWRQQEEVWESFHAVWTLSQPGMPLSADGWQRTQMAAAAAASESAEGNGERPETQNTFLVSAPGFRVPVFGSAGPSPPSSPLHAGRKQIKTPSVSPATTTITAAPAPTHVSVGSGTAALNVTIDVPFDRPLFPSFAETAGTPESATLQPAAASIRSGPHPSAATATPLLPSVHNSLYFCAVRGGSATSCKGTAPLLPTEASPPAVSRLLPVEGLAPDRLTTLQRTLEASAQVVRVATAQQGSLGPLKKLSAVQERVGSGRRNVAPTPPPPTVAAATSIPIEFSTLRTIQETKYAVIPPPWEDARARAAVSGAKKAVARSPRAVVASLGATGALEATPNCIGVVSAATTQQEALTEILVLLHDVYSLKELQALEGEYGGAELLRLLPLREWSALGSESGAGEVVSTAVAARQAMTVLSHPDHVGNAAGGGGGNVRGPASQHDRKCFAASKGTAHRGNTRAGSAGLAAARGGGGADAVGGVPTVAAALDAARAALHREPQLVWQLLTGPYMVAGATAGGNSGVVVALGKSSEDAGGSVSLIRKNSSSSAASTAPSTEAIISSNAGARANAAAASAPPVSLQDPEAVQHLVRPIGPYASHVLGPLLTLLRAPVAEEGVESMCDALAAHHAVHERTIAAASILKATAAELQPRSSSAGPRSKKESLLVTEENGSAEAKSRKSARGAAPAFLPDGGASTSLLPVSSAAGPQTRSSAKAAQMLLQQHSRQWVAAQLTLTAVLTALLFSPAFVRSRVAYLEEKLTRATSATAAASVATAADHAGQKGGGAAATLPLLFHRVQAVKMHAARVEAALAAAGPSATTSEALRLLDPAQVLAAYTGRR